MNIKKEKPQSWMILPEVKKTLHGFTFYLCIFGIFIGTAGITVMASGCHRMRSLARENLALREENARLSSNEREILQEYIRVYRENKSLKTTREGVDLENLVLRDQLRSSRQVQERLREKAFTQDPVSNRGEASITPGNEIEVVQVVQVDPPMVACPYEPYVIPGDLLSWAVWGMTFLLLCVQLKKVWLVGLLWFLPPSILSAFHSLFVSGIIARKSVHEPM